MPRSNSIKPSTGTQHKHPAWADAFLIEVLSTADSIARFPEAWHPLGEGIHRCRLSRFPYGLIYAIDNGDIWQSRTYIAVLTIGAIACSDDLVPYSRPIILGHG